MQFCHSQFGQVQDPNYLYRILWMRVQVFYGLLMLVGIDKCAAKQDISMQCVFCLSDIIGQF